MNSKLSLSDTDIYIGDDALLSLNSFIEKKNPTKIFILLDENTREKCLPILIDFMAVLKESIPIQVAPGELSKSMRTVEHVCELLLENDIDRHSLIINLGGGVICDLGGFIASIIKRGVDFINIPTSLMAQVDAAIGGKVAVNFKNHKNQLGLFSSPSQVIVYPPFLNSLLYDDFLSAKSEILKYALIFDIFFWKELSKNSLEDMSYLRKILTQCIKIKIDIVSQDYYDYNHRKILNFGHSIAHAVEATFLEKNTIISHGFSLFIGLLCESYISHKVCKLSKSSLIDIEQKILHIFPLINLRSEYDNCIIKYLKSDKKNQNGNFYFTLLNEIGDASINCKVSLDDICDSLKYYRKLCQM